MCMCVCVCVLRTESVFTYNLVEKTRCTGGDGVMHGFLQTVPGHNNARYTVFELFSEVNP